MVVGDVNSTMACSIVAKKMNTDVAHVEAGIRSYDMEMPEEINRLVTDAISDHFFTTSHVANENLAKAGIESKRIHFVGNTMIDTLMSNMERTKRPAFWDDFSLRVKDYLVLTLHRPSNVDDPHGLKMLMQEILDSSDCPLVFPVHPRTMKNLEAAGIKSARLLLVPPMGYLEFIFMLKNSKGVITDSGGIQEETTVMGIPCITLRNNTERPETVTIGTNEVIGTTLSAVGPAMKKLLAGEWKKGSIPELWDGKTSDRIVAKLRELYLA
jgi:UDP-N-acetylglucosamine 2-epimerase (non-hydrolysing)